MAVTTYWLDQNKATGANDGTSYADAFQSLSDLDATLGANTYSDTVVVNVVAGNASDSLPGLTLATLSPASGTIPQLNINVTDSGGSLTDDPAPWVECYTDLVQTATAADFEQVWAGVSGWTTNSGDDGDNMWRVKTTSESALLNNQVVGVCYLEKTTDTSDPYDTFYASNAVNTLHSDSGQPGLQRVHSGGWRGTDADADALGAVWRPYNDYQFSTDGSAGNYLTVYAEANPTTYFNKMYISVYPAWRFNGIEKLVIRGQLRSRYSLSLIQIVTTGLTGAMEVDIDLLDNTKIHGRYVHQVISVNYGGGTHGVFGVIKNCYGYGNTNVVSIYNKVDGGDLEIDGIRGRRVGAGPVKGSGVVKAEGGVTAPSGNKITVHHCIAEESPYDNNGIENPAPFYFENTANIAVDVHSCHADNVPACIMDNNTQVGRLRAWNMTTAGNVPRFAMTTNAGTEKNTEYSHSRIVLPNSDYWRNPRKENDNRGRGAFVTQGSYTPPSTGTRTIRAVEIVGDDSGAANQYLVSGNGYADYNLDSTVRAAGLTALCINGSNSTADQTPAATVTTTAETAVSSGYPTAGASGNPDRPNRRDYRGMPQYETAEQNAYEYTPLAPTTTTQVA